MTINFRVCISDNAAAGNEPKTTPPSRTVNYQRFE